MNEPVWNSKTSNEILSTPPAKYTLLSSAFFLCGGLILMFLLAASIYFFQRPVLYFVLIGFYMVLFLLLAYRNRKINSALKRFNTLLQYSSNPVHVTDNHGITRSANHAFLLWSGLNQSSVIGRNLFDLMKITTSTGSKESVWFSAELNLLSGKVWTGEVEFTRADGQLVIAELILSPVLDTNGMLSECIALVNDHAGQKELTRNMDEPQSQYRSIVESSLDGIMVVQNERLVYVNPSAVSLFVMHQWKKCGCLIFQRRSLLRANHS